MKIVLGRVWRMLFLELVCCIRLVGERGKSIYWIGMGGGDGLYVLVYLFFILY